MRFERRDRHVPTGRRESQGERRRRGALRRSLGTDVCDHRREFLHARTVRDRHDATRDRRRGVDRVHALRPRLPGAHGDAFDELLAATGAAQALANVEQRGVALALLALRTAFTFVVARETEARETLDRRLGLRCDRDDDFAVRAALAVEHERVLPVQFRRAFERVAEVAAGHSLDLHQASSMRTMSTVSIERAGTTSL
jgi:hypothetical protein